MSTYGFNILNIDLKVIIYSLPTVSTMIDQLGLDGESDTEDNIVYLQQYDFN